MDVVLMLLHQPETRRGIRQHVGVHQNDQEQQERRIDNEFTFDNLFHKADSIQRWLKDAFRRPPRPPSKGLAAETGCTAARTAFRLFRQGGGIAALIVC